MSVSLIHVCGHIGMFSWPQEASWVKAATAREQERRCFDCEPRRRRYKGDDGQWVYYLQHGPGYHAAQREKRAEEGEG
ncbi:hypothetical protein AB0A05_27030 [Streptomyces sp. NPDC046374]|uniref:hypothetical protein n=1 Tax=Streptomyces sp. NPDC046374 TaxID=3154917 RepID=UPI00340E932A